MSNSTVHCPCGEDTEVTPDVDRFTCPACGGNLKRGRIGWGHDFTEVQEAIAAIPSRPPEETLPASFVEARNELRRIVVGEGIPAHLLSNENKAPDGYFRRILYCGKQEIAACDGLCHKAWGISGRDRIDHDDWDDQTWLADVELGVAPRDPGTYEGGEGKHPGSLNKWCVRECERSTLTVDAEGMVQLTDWSKRVHNVPARGENATITIRLSSLREVF